MESKIQNRNGSVLLYYCYVSLPGQLRSEMHAWYQESCEALGLKGRVRVAHDGVNVTVGGPMVMLLQHIEAVKSHPSLMSKSIDFKLAENIGVNDGGGGGSGNTGQMENVIKETGFDTLCVRLCKELVTLGPLAEGKADPNNAGMHLSPEEFHTMALESASESVTSSGQGVGRDAGGSGTVLLDCRNLYETRIGHFDLDGLPHTDPRTRCFSDLPAWMDRMEHTLRGKRVLMYCTGGVRCERASAYLREKGPGFENVFQLQGGIQRYLETFKSGGLFKGKNFVYDDRIAVGPSARDGDGPIKHTSNVTAGLPSAYSETQSKEYTPSAAVAPPSPADACTSPNNIPLSAEAVRGDRTQGSPLTQLEFQGSVVGVCQVCARPWDDYSQRERCHLCRILLVVCEACHTSRRSRQQRQQYPRDSHGERESSQERELCDGDWAGGGPSGPSLSHLLCELCVDRNSNRPQARHRRAQPSPLAVVSSSSLSDNGGDSSHTPSRIPISSPCTGDRRDPSGRTKEDVRMVRFPTGGCACIGSRSGGFNIDRRLRILCLHGFRQTGSKMMGRTSGLRKHLDDVADFYFPDAPHVLPHFVKHAAQDPEVGHCNSISPGGLSGNAASKTTLTGKDPSAPVSNPIVPKRAWLFPPELSPFLQASCRGAIVQCPAPQFVDESQYTRQTEGWEASEASLRDFVNLHGPFDGVLGFSQGSAVAAYLCSQQQAESEGRCMGGAPSWGFRFAVLSSGFVSACPSHRRMLDSIGGIIKLPSLHVFGGVEKREAGYEDPIADEVNNSGRVAVASGEMQQVGTDCRTKSNTESPQSLKLLPESNLDPDLVDGSGDRQIDAVESERLLALFDSAEGRRVVRHGRGHVLPCKRSIAMQIKAFLVDQLQRDKRPISSAP